MQASLNLKSIFPYRFGKKRPDQLTSIPVLKQKSISLVSRDDSPEKTGRQ